MRLILACCFALTGAVFLSSCAISTPAAKQPTASESTRSSPLPSPEPSPIPTQVEYIPNGHLIPSMTDAYWPVTANDVDVTPFEGKRVKSVTKKSPGGTELEVTGVGGTYHLVLDAKVWNRSEKTIRPWEELNLYLADKTGQLISEMAVSSSQLDGGSAEDSPLPSMNEGDFKLLFSVGHRGKPVYLVMSEDPLGLYKSAVPTDEISFLELADFGF